MKRYIVHYGHGGKQECKGQRALADFIHNLLIDYGPSVLIRVELSK